MKTWKYTIAICLAASLAACSKNNEISGPDKLVSIRSTGESVVTGWESGYSWTTGDSANYVIYAHNRAMNELTPEILNSGAVLIWIKNYTSDEGTVVQKPARLPFSVLPAIGKPAYNNYWYYMPSAASVELKFRSNKRVYTNDPVPVPNANVQFRYFLVPGSELNRLGYTPVTISQLSYEQLIDVLGAGE